MRCGSGCFGAGNAFLSGAAHSVSTYETNSITFESGSCGSTTMQHVCVVFVDGSRYTRWIARTFFASDAAFDLPTHGAATLTSNCCVEFNTDFEALNAT